MYKLHLLFYCTIKLNKGGTLFMFIKYNPNPKGDRVGDCTARAIQQWLDEMEHKR